MAESPEAKLKALMQKYNVETDILSEEPTKTLASHKKKTHHAQKAKPADGGASDDELKDNPPPFNYYNSYEGYMMVAGEKVYHGNNGIQAPVLTDAEWATKCERFDYYQWVVNEKTHLKEWTKVNQPAHLTKLDQRLMDLINKYDRILILVHRGSRKSTNMLRRAKRVILDKGETVVYFSCAGTNVEEYSESIRSELTDPPILRAYGNVIDPKRTNSKTKMFWIHQTEKRLPGLSVGTSEGKTRMGTHPDYIFLDDVVREDADTSKVQQKNLRRWWSKQVLPMAKSNTQIVVVGTVKGMEDLYGVIAEDPTFTVFKIPAIEEFPNGGQREPSPTIDDFRWYCVYEKNEFGKNILKGIANIQGGVVSNDEFDMENWAKKGRIQYYLQDKPELGYDGTRMSLQEFLIRKISMGDEAFESEYQMNPVAMKEGYLKFKNLRWFDEYDPDLPQRQYRFQNTNAMLDQAFGDGQASNSDWNALSIVDEVDGQYFILDILIWRGGGYTQKKEMIKGIKQKYPFIRSIGVEAGYMQSEDVKQLQNDLPDLNIKPIYQERRKPKDEDGIEGPKIAIDFVNSDIPVAKRAKVLRIADQWKIKLELERVWIFSGINQESISQFKLQWGFPKCQKFDIIDSIGSCFELCGEGSVANFFWLHG